MSSTSSAVSDKGFTRDQFEALIASRQQPTWLSALRRRAMDVCESLPLPDSTMEEWRRTPLRMFRLHRFGPLSPAPEVVPQVASVLDPLLAPGGRLLTLNGRKAAGMLSPKWAEQGVVFDCLEDSASGPHEDLVREHFFSILDAGYDRFAALHAAFWTGGGLCYIPRGVKVDEPLFLLSALGADQSDLGHLLVVLDEGAEATLVSETASLDASGPGLYCGGIEIVLKPGARLRFVNLQNWNNAVWHFAHQKAVLQEGAYLEWTLGALGGFLAKVNQHLVLDGVNAEAVVNGVMFTENRRHLAYHTLQHHKQPFTRSDLLYKGALQDQSHLVWRGMIRVDEGAVKTDGYQRNDNLILSDRARTDCIPGLEILADDVRCTHGATAGRVDDEEIFYAQTRGLTQREAARMIVTGFFQQVFDRITIDSVREALAEVIGRKVREYR